MPGRKRVIVSERQGGVVRPLEDVSPENESP